MSPLLLCLALLAQVPDAPRGPDAPDAPDAPQLPEAADGAQSDDPAPDQEGAPSPEVEAAGEAAPATEAPGGAGAPGTLIPPEYRAFYRNTSVLRYNAIGVIDDARMSFRKRLYANANPAFNNNFVALAVSPQLSPGFLRVGVGVELQPASFVTVWANYEAVGYFGIANGLQSFPSASADSSDRQIEKLGRLPEGNPGRNYGTFGGQLNAGVDLQFKVGPLAARNLFRAMRPDYILRFGDRVYYDPAWDLLVPNHGVLINNDTDVLFVTDFGLTAGLRFNIAHAFHGKDQLALGESLRALDSNIPQTRVGPLLAYTFFDDEGALFDRPTILLVANWWLTHRYRAGAEVSQAIPFVVVGFQFQGDVIPWRRPK